VSARATRPLSYLARLLADIALRYCMPGGAGRAADIAATFLAQWHRENPPPRT
jgi:hypothetical protein